MYHLVNLERGHHLQPNLTGSNIHVAAEMDARAEEFNLYSVWRVLVGHCRLIFGVAMVVTLVAILFTLLQANIYQSSAVLMPLVASRSGLSAALVDLGGFLPGGAGGIFGKESPSDRLLAVLQSRSLAFDVVQHLDLLSIFFASQWDADQQRWRKSPPPTVQDAVRRLKTIVSIAANRQGVITIAVEHTDSALAAAIANRYVQALQQVLHENAFTTAKKNRLFIAAQLEKTRQDVAAIETALKEFEQTYKIVSLEDQTSAAVEAIASLEEKIMEKEVQRGVQQRLFKGSSREVYLLEEELNGLRAQLTRLQRGSPRPPGTPGTKAVEDDGWITADEVPDVKLRYGRLLREAQVQGKIYTLLAQQLEQAKIEEVRDETAFQIIDRAVPADRESKPRRVQTVALAVFSGLFLGIVLAFFRESFNGTVRSKDQVERLLGLPLLASIPALASPRQKDARPLLGQGEVTEALRYLYTRLRHLQGQPQTVLLVGTAPEDDTTSLLVQLAIVAAHASEKVLIIDGNGQYPTLHHLLQLQLTPGLAEILATPEHWQQGIQQTSIENLHLLAAGTAPPSPLGTLEASAFAKLLGHYKAAYDLILCTAPSFPRYTAAAVLGSTADATCLVLTSGLSRLDISLEAKDTLEAVHAYVAGAILTNCQRVLEN